MGALKRLLLWRWRGRRASLLSVVTGIVMIVTGFLLLNTHESAITTLFYFNDFWGGRIDPLWLAWGIIVGGMIVPFRDLSPIHMFLVALPWTTCATIIALVTLADPGPAHPWLRLWFWAHAPLLTGATGLDNIRHRGHNAVQL